MELLQEYMSPYCIKYREEQESSDYARERINQGLQQVKEVRKRYRDSYTGLIDTLTGKMGKFGLYPYDPDYYKFESAVETMNIILAHPCEGEEKKRILKDALLDMNHAESSFQGRLNSIESFLSIQKESYDKAFKE